MPALAIAPQKAVCTASPETNQTRQQACHPGLRAVIQSFGNCSGKVERWNGSPETSPPSYILCHHGKSGPPLGWLTRDPVFSGSFEVQADFGIEEIKASYLAGLNSKPTPALKQRQPSYIPCHPGLSGSSPKRVAVWWGDLTRDPVFLKHPR